MSILIIGGTTKGIGRRFTDMTDGTPHRVFVPEPEVLDVRDPNIIQEYLDDNGPMDFTLYCAGVKHLNWIRDIELSDLEDTFAVNVFGFVNVLNKLMGKQLAGRVCVVTSDAAINPMRTSLDYCSSKAALEMAIRIAARELPDWHITGIRPSVVSDTEMTYQDIRHISKLRGWSEADVVENMHNMIPPEDVAELAHWLLFSSPQSMSGSIVDIRGGN